MTNLINFRDFGGHATCDGRQVVRGRLFRSGHLGSLADADIIGLIAHDFALVVDLRYPDERDSDRSPWPDHWDDRVIAHGGSGDDAPHLGIMRAAVKHGGGIDPAYCSFYAALPFDPLYRDVFTTALQRIASTVGPVLVHCTAGKDRTGVLVALLLSLLGVPGEDVVDDYMRSLRAPGFDTLRVDVAKRLSAFDDAPITEARIDALIGVKPMYIRAAMQSVTANCGSVEAYFRERGVQDDTFAALRQSLTA